MKNRKVTSHPTPANAASLRSNARPVIGFLCPRVNYSITQELWAGISDVVAEQGANLVCLAGSGENLTDESLDRRAVLFNLIDPRNFDGLILWGSALFHHLEVEETLAFCARYRPLPLVSIGNTLAKIPEILVNNYQGMYNAVVHLIEAHGYQKIAFIRGPEGHPEGEERFRAYTDALAAFSLAVDPHLVLPGTFLYESGVAAAKILLDERKLRPRTDFEAIVAANDEMILAVAGVFQERGIRKPDEVALVGFDDSPEARLALPPLTTVRQPMYENGRRAAEILFALLAGKEVPLQTKIPTELVIRQSCGCVSPRVIAAGIGSIQRVTQPLATAMVERQEKIRTEIARIMGASATAAAWAGPLLDSLVADLSAGPGDAPSLLSPFLVTLQRALRQAAAAGEDIIAWQEMMSVLGHSLWPYLDEQQLLQSLDLWQQARVMVSEMAWQVQSNQTLHAKKQAEVLREISHLLSTSFEVEELLNVLVRSLPLLEIPSCYLFLYENPARPTEWSQLVLAYRNNQRLALEPENCRFPSRQLMPEGLLPPGQLYRMVVIPLFFRYQQWGYVFFEAKPREGNLYEVVGGEISTALQGALLMKQEESRSRQLQTVAEVSTAVSTVLDTTDLLQRVVNLTKARFGLYHAHIYLLNESQDKLVLAAGAGEVGRQMVAQDWSIPLDAEQSLVARAARIRRGEVINNVKANPHWLPNPLLLDTCSELAVPLIVGEQVLGVLDVQADQINYFTEDDVRIQSTLAAQVAVALKNAQLYREEAQRVQELAQLNADLKAVQAELLRQERLATLGQLTATVSHEIRNPLATIRASAFVIDRQTRDRGLGVEPALDRIERNITRCDSIITELLDYTRMGKLNPQAVLFDDWLQQVLDEQTCPKGITLSKEMAAGVEISLDPERFRRVIINLIDNACQAMLEWRQSNDRSLVLSIQSKVVDQKLRLSISDTGPGIPPDVLPHIFDPLYSTKGFGAGLGLPIAREIVNQHSGKLEITSELGKGTQAILWLPLLRPERDKE
ncbi:MAG: substrate-binding domain-containing protein [Anaerolineae bacterium]|nr:substrate-binding domain-containing protein [Anaerolineae bacterium]